MSVQFQKPQDLRVGANITWATVLKSESRLYKSAQIDLITHGHSATSEIEVKKQTWIKNLSRPQLCSGSRTRSYQWLIFRSSLSVLVVLVLGSVPLASLFLPCFTADVLSVSCSANQIIMMEHSPVELLFPFFILSSKTLSIPKPCCSLSHRTDLSSQYSSVFHPFFPFHLVFFSFLPVHLSCLTGVKSFVELSLLCKRVDIMDAKPSSLWLLICTV